MFYKLGFFYTHRSYTYFDNNFIIYEKQTAYNVLQDKKFIRFVYINLKDFIICE